MAWRRIGDKPLSDLMLTRIFVFNSKSLFAILHEYTQNTETANNTDVYAASFTSNKVQRNHQIKWQKGARNLKKVYGPLNCRASIF